MNSCLPHLITKNSTNNCQYHYNIPRVANLFILKFIGSTESPVTEAGTCHRAVPENPLRIAVAGSESRTTSKYEARKGTVPCRNHRCPSSEKMSCQWVKVNEALV